MGNDGAIGEIDDTCDVFLNSKAASEESSADAVDNPSRWFRNWSNA